MVGREHVAAGLELSQQLFGHLDLVDLGRAIGQAHLERPVDQVGEGHFIAGANRTMDVQGPCRDIVQHLWHRRLDRTNVFSDLLVILVFVDAPRRAHHQQAELFQLDPGVGYPLLNHLLVC